jgi:ADP-ribosylglycohydrolase
MTDDADDQTEAIDGKSQRLSASKVRDLTKPSKHTDDTVQGLCLDVGKVRKDGKPSKNWRRGITDVVQQRLGHPG